MCVAFVVRIREIDGRANNLQEPPMNGRCPVPSAVEQILIAAGEPDPANCAVFCARCDGRCRRSVARRRAAVSEREL
jgi:hypothetical protein